MNAPPALRLQTVPPQRGLAWVQRAIVLFLRRPAAFTLLFLSFLFVALFVLSLPVVGPVLVMMALPLLSLGFMVATRSALKGGPVHPGVYVDLLRGQLPRRRTLLQLCALYALGSVLIVGLSDLIDGGRFEQLQIEMVTEGGDPGPLLADARLQFGLVVRVALTTLLALPFWHAPALVWWGRQGVAQSLFSSCLACWRNRGALLVYALAWAGLITAFGLLAATLLSLLGARELAGIVALPAGLMFSCAFYASLYFTFADSFIEATSEPPPAEVAADGDGSPT